jgi:hypothetical protein
MRRWSAPFLEAPQRPLTRAHLCRRREFRRALQIVAVANTTQRRRMRARVLSFGLLDRARRRPHAIAAFAIGIGPVWEAARIQPTVGEPSRLQKPRQYRRPHVPTGRPARREALHTEPAETQAVKTLGN